MYFVWPIFFSFRNITYLFLSMQWATMLWKIEVTQAFALQKNRPLKMLLCHSQCFHFSSINLTSVKNITKSFQDRYSKSSKKNPQKKRNFLKLFKDSHFIWMVVRIQFLACLEKLRWTL